MYPVFILNNEYETKLNSVGLQQKNMCYIVFSIKFVSYCEVNDISNIFHLL